MLLSQNSSDNVASQFFLAIFLHYQMFAMQGHSQRNQKNIVCILDITKIKWITISFCDYRLLYELCRILDINRSRTISYHFTRFSEFAENLSRQFNEIESCGFLHDLVQLPYRLDIYELSNSTSGSSYRASPGISNTTFTKNKRQI